MEFFSLWSLPPLTMLRPKKRMIRHKSQPRPVLSGQFTVITVGSPSFSDCLIITTSSSYKIPICWSSFFPFSSSSFFSFLNLRVGFCCCCCCCCCCCWCWWWWWWRRRCTEEEDDEEEQVKEQREREAEDTAVFVSLSALLLLHLFLLLLFPCPFFSSSLSLSFFFIFFRFGNVEDGLIEILDTR